MRLLFDFDLMYICSDKRKLICGVVIVFHIWFIVIRFCLMQQKKNY